MKADPSKHNMSPPPPPSPARHSLLPHLHLVSSSRCSFSPIVPAATVSGPSSLRVDGLSQISRIHRYLSIVWVAFGNTLDSRPSKSNIWFINSRAPESSMAKVRVILPEDSGTFGACEPKTRRGVGNTHELPQLFLSHRDSNGRI